MLLLYAKNIVSGLNYALHFQHLSQEIRDCCSTFLSMC